MENEIPKLEAELSALRVEQDNVTQQFLSLKKKTAESSEIDAVREQLKVIKERATEKQKEILALDKDWKEKKPEKKKKKNTEKKVTSTSQPKKSGGGGGGQPKGGQMQGGKGLGMRASKSDDFASWYTEVITHAELIEYYDVSGCYILRPWAFSMWEQIVKFFDAEIKKLGVLNASFPLLVSKNALEREKDHIEGFAPEVAWVTKSGETELMSPVAIRPTSETIMYPAYAKWIRSHRDLPLKLNQWANVVRWEFKHPVPFLRSREFLWQEGHSAFATLEEASEEVLQILELYSRVYEELMAVPVVKGRKSEGEKFAGGLYTTTVEAFIPQNGRGIQGATSHCLGQNFSKMFKIQFENENVEKAYAWQNSWGITTRTLGVLIMVHGDDKGLVLPPRMAPIQVVVVPILYQDQDNQALTAKSTELARILCDAGIRAHFDGRLNTPGWKYNDWDMKGVPFHIEFGPRDMKNNQCVLVPRIDLTQHTGSKNNKITVSLDQLVERTQTLLELMQNTMLDRARAERDSRIVETDSWDEFMAALDAGNMVLAPWCDNTECEDDVKRRSAGRDFVPTAEEIAAKAQKEEEQARARRAKHLQRLIEKYQQELAVLQGEPEPPQLQENAPTNSQEAHRGAHQPSNQESEESEEQVKDFGLKAAAKTLCKPFDHPELRQGAVCFACKKAAIAWTLWGRSY